MAPTAEPKCSSKNLGRTVSVCLSAYCPISALAHSVHCQPDDFTSRQLPFQPVCWKQSVFTSVCLEKGIQIPMAQGRSTKIISIIRWIRTSRLSINNSLSACLSEPRMTLSVCLLTALSARTFHLKPRALPSWVVSQLLAIVAASRQLAADNVTRKASQFQTFWQRNLPHSILFASNIEEFV